VTVTIRRARVAEAAALTDLSIRSKASNGYDADFMAACRDELTVTPARMRSGTYWVAAEDDALCGCVALGMDEGCTSGEVNAFFVDPGWQRRGVGLLLWYALRDEAQARGLVRLHLAADPAAVAFYERIGFVTMGSIPSGSIKGRSLPHMTLALS
jgi:N-acetylglutamate synthase-like GNAT family acetyltransferase